MKTWHKLGIVALVCAMLANPGPTDPPKARKGSEEAPPGPQSRIRIFNMTSVVRNYDKYKTFRADMKSAMTPFQEKDQSLKKELDAVNKELQNPLIEVSKREQLEEKARSLKHDAEANQKEAREAVGKRADEQMQDVFRDVVDVVTRYSQVHHIELVLHYNDATNEKDYYSSTNIARKLQSGACMPLYAAPGMDISQEIIKLLNDQYHNKNRATPGQAPGPPADVKERPKAPSSGKKP